MAERATKELRKWPVGPIASVAVLVFIIGIFLFGRYYTPNVSIETLEKKDRQTFATVQESGIPPYWMRGPKGVGFTIFESTAEPHDTYTIRTLRYGVALDYDAMVKEFEQFFPRYMPERHFSKTVLPAAHMTVFFGDPADRDRLRVEITPGEGGTGTRITMIYEDVT